MVYKNHAPNLIISGWCKIMMEGTSKDLEEHHP